jgi:nicotinate-nucleotide adenylyltransferase
MNVLLYGGAFDPLHCGHVDIINHLQTQALCQKHDSLVEKHDRLVIVPSGIPVYKTTTYFSNHDRLAMLKLMYDNHKNIDILTVEIEKSTPSYSIDTIQFLFESYGATAITLVIGMDQWLQFDRWKSYNTILTRCKVLVILRDSMSFYCPTALLPYQHRVTLSPFLPTNISSTRVRLMCQKHQSLRGMVPNKIISFIDTHWKPYQ